VQIFYFGPTDAPLFGVFHAPAPETARSTGVVVCPPLGHELAHGHALCRRLAEVCAGRGYAVLRFDYYGTGDSAGETEDVTVDRCLGGIAAAAEELRRRSACAEVCLVGLRLGATLALLYGARREEARALAALDPLWDGRAYVGHLRALEEAAWKGLGDLPAERLKAAQARALLGMRWAAPFVQELQALDLRGLTRRPARSVAIFRSTGGEDGGGDGGLDPALLPDLFGGVETRALAARMDSRLGDFIWTPGGAPAQIADWLETACP